MKATKTPRTSGTGPINIKYNGTSQPVTLDTAVPGNTIPIPTISVDAGGNIAPGALESTQQLVKTAVQSIASLGATAALQTAGNASLSSIDTKTPSLGQALAAGSVPVVLTALQLAALTPPTTVTANQGTANVTPWNVAVSNFPATQPISGTVSVSNFPATQPISAAALPLPAGAASETTLSALNAKVTTVNTGAVTISAALPVGSNVIGKFSIDQTTPGSTNLVALAANQSVNNAQINGVTPLMGNGVTGTGSQRVTIASDNTAFNVLAQSAAPVAKTVKSAVVSVGTSAVRATTDGGAVTAGRVLLLVRPLDANLGKIYIGPAGVTAATGLLLYPGESQAFNLDAGEYYLISDTAAQSVYILEQE